MLLQRDAFTKYFPLPLRTIKLARERGREGNQYYFVLQSLRKVKVLPSTTSYNKACTAGERGREGNQYYFELQSLQKAKLAQGKEGARGQPVLLRTTNLVES